MSAPAGFCFIGIFISQPVGVFERRRLSAVNFHALIRRRLVKGRPIRSGLLAAYGALGALGLVVGTMFMLKLVENYTWLRSMDLFNGRADFSISLFPLLLLWMSAALVWSVLQQSELELPEGEVAKLIAAAVIEAEQAEVAIEREEAKKSLSGWLVVLLLAGFLGGLALSLQLPDAGQASALICGFIGFELGAVTTYLAKTRPWGRWIWQGLALAASAAGVIYVWQSFPRTGLFIVAGLVWGVAFGTALVIIYLRTVERRKRREAG